MKTLKLLGSVVILCCFSIASQAQSKTGTYGLQVEAGYAFNLSDSYSDYAYQAFNIAASPGYHITENLFAGIGVALYDYRYSELITNVYGSDSGPIDIKSSFVSAPVYAHGMWKFRSGAKPSWFVSLKAGYGVILKSKYSISQSSNGIISEDYSGGLFASPSVGYMYPINRKNAISLSVSYDLQKYTATTKTDIREFKKDKTNSTIAVKVGWAF